MRRLEIVPEDPLAIVWNQSAAMRWRMVRGIRCGVKRRIRGWAVPVEEGYKFRVLALVRRGRLGGREECAAGSGFFVQLCVCLQWLEERDSL